VDGAQVIVDAEGRCLEANAPALEMLGVTLDELRAAPPGMFSSEPPDPEAAVAFRAAWEAAGRPDVTGETTLVRPDGTATRVRFAIRPQADGRYVAVFEPIARPLDDESQLRTVGAVLAAWRAAERRLESLERGSPEWLAVQEEVEWLQRRHATAFEEERGTQ
jgi:PAS domain-containing protein